MDSQPLNDVTIRCFHCMDWVAETNSDFGTCRFNPPTDRDSPWPRIHSEQWCQRWTARSLVTSGQTQCDFCDQSQKDGVLLIKGRDRDGESHWICSDCVDIFSKTVGQEV